MSKKIPPRGTVEHFQAFLAAADRVALAQIVRYGISYSPEEERDELANAIADLAQAFYAGYATTDEDDVCTFEELRAKVSAAQMVGLAMGLRLQGADLGQHADPSARRGGAR